MCCTLVVSVFMLSRYFLNSLSGELKITLERILSSFVFGVSTSGVTPSLISYSAPVFSNSTVLPSTRLSLIFFFLIAQRYQSCYDIFHILNFFQNLDYYFLKSETLLTFLRYVKHCFTKDALYAGLYCINLILCIIVS